MKEIPLSRGMVALVDDEDSEDLSRFKWYAHPTHHTFYAARGIRLNGKHIIEMMHRRILDVEPGELVDHKNHNGIDNRRENIRTCTVAENAKNRLKRTSASSRFKGVCWDAINKKWKASIKLNKKLRHIGLFADEEDAARAYDREAVKTFGAFRCLNFQEEPCG